jgi:voltage-gated sodium channel
VVAFAKRVTQSAWFGVLIVALILISGIVSGIETYLGHGESATPLYHRLMTIQSMILWIFVIEIVLKMLACDRQPWRYFSVGWNVFDFLIVAVCLLPADTQFATVFRMARLVRMLRLITILPQLQVLVSALLKSIPSLAYIGILLGLHFYMYAVTGTFLFRDNDPIRFGNLHSTFLTLFEVLTLEGWNDVLNTQYLGSDINYDDAWKERTQGLRHSSAQPLVASIYFVSFIMMGTMIMLNLFTGVIINSMEEASNEAAQADRKQHLRQTGRATIGDELALISQQLAAVTGAIDALRDDAAKIPLDSEPPERLA